MRNSIRLPRGISVFSSAMPRRSSTDRAASTALANSTTILSPVVLTMRPRCLASVGSLLGVNRCRIDRAATPSPGLVFARRLSSDWTSRTERIGDAVSWLFPALGGCPASFYIGTHLHPADLADLAEVRLCPQAQYAAINRHSLTSARRVVSSLPSDRECRTPR
jgi:hypothetical protein